MKYTLENIGDTVIVHPVEKNIRININGVLIGENLISSIEIFKYTGETRQRIFVELKSGHMYIATLVDDEVIIEEQRYPPKGDEKVGRLYGYTIRVPQEYDK